jgi:ribosomal protein S18 acetylase RimI-like enzyme
MVSIKKVEVNDLDTLLKISKDTFYEFFAHLNTPENMEAYSAVAFTPEHMLAQLNNPDSEFYFAMWEDEPVGYIKLNYNDAQSEFKEKNALEIERIYVTGNHHGKQLGKHFINFAVNIATEKNFNYVWLGVWEHNHNAIGFYRHHGFVEFSSHYFLLGDDRQKDILMKRMLV